MDSKGQASYLGDDTDPTILIEIDLQVLAKKLANDPKFIEAITKKVREAQTKNVRPVGNVFGRWGGTR
jgi:hypothetical protein